MKNTRLTKILILALSLALLIGAAIGLSASAEDESLVILSQNVSYEGKTHLYYAVHYENVDKPEDIALVVSYTDDEGAAQNVTVSESEEITLRDSDGNPYVCRAFRTPGVAAKNFTTKFTVKAIYGTTESAEKTYSVAEYCHQWLAYLAGVSEPSEADAKVGAACEATLNYGTKIQELLDYYPNGNTADYPDNYVLVSGNDGVTVNGGKTAFVIKGAEVALGYTGNGTRTGWKVVDAEGNSITVTDDKFIASSYISASPMLDDATGYYYLSDAAGMRYDYDAGAALPQHQDGQSCATLENVDGSVKFTKTATGSGTSSTFRWTPGVTKTSDIYVFEADMKFENVTSTTIGWIRIAACDKYLQLTVNQSADNIIIYSGTTANGCSVKEGVWQNVRFECDFANSTVVLCVDNVPVYTWENISTSSASGSQYARFSMDSSAKVGDTYYFDNVFMGYVEKLTTAE